MADHRPAGTWVCRSGHRAHDSSGVFHDRDFFFCEDRMNDDWQAVCAILRTEAPDQAAAIEARLIAELPGLRLTIPSRISISREEAHKAVRQNGGNVDKAAKEVGLSRSSMYRRLRPEPRQDREPRMGGRLVR